jgi:hypothetical protein
MDRAPEFSAAASGPTLRRRTIKALMGMQWYQEGDRGASSAGTRADDELRGLPIQRVQTVLHVAQPNPVPIGEALNLVPRRHPRRSTAAARLRGERSRSRCRLRGTGARP